MTNNERFNELLNSCQHPREVAAALLALQEAGCLEEIGCMLEKEVA